MGPAGQGSGAGTPSLVPALHPPASTFSLYPHSDADTYLWNRIKYWLRKKKNKALETCVSFLSLCRLPASDAWARLLTSLGLSCLLLVDRTKELLMWLLKGQQALAFAIAATLCLLPVPWGEA